ncbi:MAG: DUF2273 domain-containing protein [Thermoanaerobacterales bacterium]|jgi:uncharacterized membrane protein|nr:DUF2273 domain-containing protein [Thermoanaerobacterales bacterium]
MSDFHDAWQRHRGKILGIAIGFLIGLIIIAIGFFKALFVVFCAVIGYYIGTASDNGQGIKDLLDKILPPGSR